MDSAIYRLLSALSTSWEHFITISHALLIRLMFLSISSLLPLLRPLIHSFKISTFSFSFRAMFSLAYMKSFSRISFTFEMPIIISIYFFLAARIFSSVDLVFVPSSNSIEKLIFSISLMYFLHLATIALL